jgi:serine protease Do
LDSGQTYDGVVVAMDGVHDLALVQVEVSSVVPYLRIGDVGQVALGQQVLVLGYPLDKKKITVTSGFVSNIEYDGGINVTWVQTDSAINPGDSGGPLLSLQGDVIGMVSSKIVGYGVEGVGFAIAANSVNTYLPLLLPDQG